jgi:hypothetical protein
VDYPIYYPSIAMAQASDLSKLAFGCLPPVTEKLTKGNFGMWHALVSNTLKGARLAKHIQPGAAPPDAFVAPVPPTDADGKKDPIPNPDYEE